MKTDFLSNIVSILNMPSAIDEKISELRMLSYQEEIRGINRAKNRCQYCGYEFKGLFRKKLLEKYNLSDTSDDVKGIAFEQFRQHLLEQVL